MSKTWKRHGGGKDGGHDSKKKAARAFRARTTEMDSIPVGSFYKRYFDQYSICDYNWIKPAERENYEYHHPTTNHACICNQSPYSDWKTFAVQPPEPVIKDRRWSLPDGYRFSISWNSGIQRINTATGVYEHMVYEEQWEFVGSRPANASFVFGACPNYWRGGCRIEWRSKDVEVWVENIAPKVVRTVELPYFTAKGIRRHVDEREKQTRNYRKKIRFPRYWRRDRKRTRRMKVDY